MLVVIDSPRAGGYYGGVVAAPIFKRIAEAAIRHLGIPRIDQSRAAGRDGARNSHAEPGAAR